MIRVRLESNGDYWRAAWAKPTGGQGSESIGSKLKFGKRAALAECAKIQKRLNNGAATGLVDGWLDWAGWEPRYVGARSGELKGNTLASHGRTFDYLIEHFGKDCRLSRITPEMAAGWRAWLGSLDGERTLAEASVCLHVRNARTIVGAAVGLGLLESNPFARLKGSSSARGDKAYVSDADASAMIEACPNGAWRRLIGLCRYAGLRRGEALRLEWDDVTATEIRVRPEGEEGTKQRFRRVPVSPRLAEILGSERDGVLVAGVGDYNLDRTLCGYLQTNGKRYHGILQRAGLEAYPRPFHSLRSSCETDWLRQYPVMDVCKWLGHSPEVAMKHYHETTSRVWDEVTGRVQSPPNVHQMAGS